MFGQQDVFAALERIRVDADQAEQARDGRADAIRSAARRRRCSAGGGANERSTDSGRPAVLPGV